MDNNKNCIYVTGFDKNIDRKTLLTEFLKFGKINKLFLPPNGQFAKVFFANKQSAEAAINQLNNSLLNWQVCFFDQRSKMANYGDGYEDEDFSENYDYCNIHGQPLVVLQADSGDLYVNLKDIKKTGFALFRRDTFDTVLVDNRQIDKEFELHLLSEAKNYILRHKVTSIDEDRILQTIERCRNKLLGGDSKNTFNSGRSVTQSSNNFTVTSSVDSGSRAGQQRSPKSLPNNFQPSHSFNADAFKGHNKQDPKQYQKGRRDNSKFNNVHNSSNSYSNVENKLNSSGSSETNGNMRRPKVGIEAGNRAPRVPKEEIPKICFEPEQTYDVVISFKEKDNIYWVQDQKYAEQLEEVILKVNDLADKLEAMTAAQGQLAIAEFEGAWNRCRVINNEPLMVHFLDYGNKSGVETVKPLPDSLKTIPALANRVVLNSESPLKEEMTVKIAIKQKYDDGTYLAKSLDGNRQRSTDNAPSKFSGKKSPPPKKTAEKPAEKTEDPEPPKQKQYFDMPKPLSELRDGDKVMLVDVESNKFIVKTKECVANNKTITEYIKNLDKSALVIPSVKVGQLVLCSKDGFPGLFRAVVVKRENDLIATVKYIDYPGESDLTVKSLRNIDDFLAEQPAGILMTPEFKALKNLNNEAQQYIGEICEKREKFTVVLSGDRFDLQREDGTLLSHVLDNMKAPKPVLKEVSEAKQSVTKKEVKPEPVPVKQSKTAKVLYDEMDWIEMEPGSYTLMSYGIQDLDDITFLSSSEDAIKHLETVTALDTDDEEPYGPEETEMCLVSYKGPDDDDATWYRAVVLLVDGDRYTVSFVDFGDMQLVNKKDIRRFPAKLKDVPILGIGCACTGIPKKPEVLNRLKELLPEGTQVEVVIKDLDGLKYQIELPELYKQLKAEKIF